MLGTEQLSKGDLKDPTASTEQQAALEPRKFGRRVIWVRGLIGLGLACLFYYFSWWGVSDHFRSPVALLALLAALPYAGIQILGNWILYFVARSPYPASPPPSGLSVDVFVTAYHEPFTMIERTLAAACAMRGEHTTWLLDDGSDPKLADLADRLGANYLTRRGQQDAKAGNLNAALAGTQGEVVVIFDADHLPKPEFLEHCLGHFADPRIGFVQVMLTFANAAESWVARAAVETSLEYYNPTSLGAYGIGGATLMGSNALIRRQALESIGGYQPGLAEDLATSIALHAAGWKSAYVAEPLAPGLAPPDFVAWFVQQLKWARGVFELLITTYPRVFGKLTRGQRLSYAVRMTKYWIGPAVSLHLLGTIVVLTAGNFQTRAAFHDYLAHIAPLVLADALIRFVALRVWRHQSISSASLARAVLLVYSTWPIYLQAWLMAVLRIPLSFRPTPKTKSGRLNPLWLLPQFAAVLLLSLGLAYTVYAGGHRTSLLLLFAILQGGLQLILLSRWMAADIFGRRRNSASAR